MFSRNRIKTTTENIKLSRIYERVDTWLNDDPPTVNHVGPYFIEGESFTPGYGKYSNISDESNSRSKVNRYKRWLNSVHPCSHTSTTMKYKDGELVIDSSRIVPGVLESFRSDIFPSAVAYAIGGMDGISSGFDPTPSPQGHGGGVFVNSLGSTPPADIDWVALFDSFGEKCDSLVPQAFFFGEDAVESGIFIDAVKLLVNPTNALRTTVKWLKKLSVGRPSVYRRGTLGSIKDILSKVSNGHLLYNFAIKPAITDVRAILNAHSEVSKRLEFIASHRGTFIPIKARQYKPVNLSLGDDVTSHAVYPQYWGRYTRYARIGTISAWGKVRSDITIQPSWKAYIEYFGLNKIVGTAWELIPFSFVVDWFTNAQERINSMTRLRASDPFTEIRNIVYSTTLLKEGTFMVTPPKKAGLYTIADQSPIPFGDFAIKVYDRFLTSPNTPIRAAMDSIGLNKYTSLGELLMQRVLK